MNKINVFDDINLENNDEIEIEYNEEFSSEKTKSLTKFPTKITNNNEFQIDNSQKNFSKSLNFNFRKCFAPKIKTKKSNKNPTPIIFRKNNNISNFNTQEQIISEDYLSEKGSSLNNESSISLDDENNNEQNNTNKKNDINLENQRLNDDNNQKNNFREIKDNISNKSKNNRNYEHKTISFFNDKKASDNNLENMKIFRNKLFKIKKNALKYINKENEFIIKEKNKEKYRLDLIKNKKIELNNQYKVIKINDIEESNSDEDNNNDISKFRKTISFINSKYKNGNTIKENNGYRIYDALLNSQKINKDKK